MLERLFGYKGGNTTIRTEVVAGVTTFITMAYILMVNPAIISGAFFDDAEMAAKVFNGVFFATCISAFIGTALMAVLAKLPFAQAPGMGLNAFFAYTVIIGAGLSYGAALGAVFLSGILFLVITLLGFREAIVKAIPKNIKIAISGGIGLFLAYVGLQGAGLVVSSESTQIELVDFSLLATGSAEEKTAVWGAILAIIGLIIIGVLYKLNIKGAIIIGIIAATLIGIPMGVTDLSFHLGGFSQQFRDFTDVSLFAFAGGLKELFGGAESIGKALLVALVVILSFSMVDLFDTIGTLLGTAKKAELLDENGEMVRMKEALLCDSIATTAGAMTGTSTVTTFVESSAGIGEGGKTGLTSAVTSVLFLVSIVLAPVIGIVPGAATAPALIIVGAMMLTGIKDIEFTDMSETLPAFLTIAIMPLTYSIANGIAFGLISYCLIKLFSGRVKETHVIVWIISALFLVRFFIDPTAI